MKKEQLIKFADFETNNSNPTRVWLAGICNLDETDFQYFNNLDDFLNYLVDTNVDICYFHNAKFDTGFIIPWLLHHDHYFVDHFSEKVEKYKQCRLLQSAMGGFYEIQFFLKRHKIVIRDSYKIINQSVENIAKVFGMNINKRKIDYSIIHDENYKANELEILYLKNDLFVVARALKYYLEKYRKLTISSIAFASLYTFYEHGEYTFYNIFSRPSLEEDTFLRKAYFGGICKVTPRGLKYRGWGYYLDVNSEYPFVMRTRPLPYGYPTKFESEQEFNKIPKYFKAFYVAEIEVSAKLKPNHTPSIIEDYNIFDGNIMLEDTTPNIIRLTLCSIDIETLYRDYDIYFFKIVRGLAYPSKIQQQIADFVDYFYQLKKEATNPYDRQFAKDMLNSASGRFGLNPKRESFGYYLDDKGVCKITKLSESTIAPIAVYVVIAITAYGRQYITSFPNTNIDIYRRLLYIDTDSLHLMGDYEKPLITPSKELGGLKIEGVFNECIYRGRKAYAVCTNDAKPVNAHISGVNKKNLLGIRKISELNHNNLTFEVKRVKKVVGGYMIVDMKLEKDFEKETLKYEERLEKKRNKNI